MRLRHLSVACAIAASAVLPSMGSPAGASPSLAATSAITSRSAAIAAQPAEPAPSQRDQLLWITNAERARAGLGPLVLSEGVADVARGWAAQLAGDLRLSHRPDLGAALNRAGVTWSASGENVGSGSHVSEVHRSFMASSAHRAILLSPAYSQIGIGVSAAGGRIWVTVDFVG